jgi:hypothetical protein
LGVAARPPHARRHAHRMCCYPQIWPPPLQWATHRQLRLPQACARSPKQSPHGQERQNQPFCAANTSNKHYRLEEHTRRSGSVAEAQRHFLWSVHLWLTRANRYWCPRRFCLKIGSQNRTPPLPEWDNTDPRNPTRSQVRVLTCDYLVGVAGFEPAASSSRTKRAAKLRHTPMTAAEV